MSFTTNYTEILETILSQAIVDGETEVIDGRYRLRLANRSARLYENDCLIHHAPLDSDMLGEQIPEFLRQVGF